MIAALCGDFLFCLYFESLSVKLGGRLPLSD
jgi:hypothetical protein